MDIEKNPNFNFIDKPYKSKYICTDCRKVFKRRVLADIDKDNHQEKEHACPDCGNKTSWVGPKFEAPKSDNIKTWNALKILHDLGLVYFIGSTKSIVLPESSKGLRDMLFSIKEIYTASITYWTSHEYTEANKDQIKYCVDQIKAIDNYLQNL